MASPEDDTENAEIVLFQVKECYVYLGLSDNDASVAQVVVKRLCFVWVFLQDVKGQNIPLAVWRWIPPRKSTASYRADEWNINKWNWEGTMKVVSKGEDCIIRLEDNTSGELYAQAPVRADQPLPIEAVIDSSRFFVLRVEDSSGPQERHAFIGIGFRERLPAYDFQAALHDHVKYVMKKKQAEELVQEYESKPSVDYSLKDGETIRLTLKPTNSTPSVKASRSKFFDQDDDSLQKSVASGGVTLSPVPFLAPPPNPTFPIALVRAASNKAKGTQTESLGLTNSRNPQEIVEDDFGDFQTAE